MEILLGENEICRNSNLLLINYKETGI